MVMIAQCLVSDPDIMILDEPMNNLDLRRELKMFNVMEKITRDRGLTTLMVLHDINFACRYSDTIAMLKDGKLYCIGSPEEVITERTIRDVYGVESLIDKDSSGNPRIEAIRSIYSD